MKKLLALVATSLVLSTSVFASATSTGNTEIRTDGYSTKAQAYEAGFDVAEDLKTASPAELTFKLPQHDVSNPSINSVEVSLEEFSAARGDISYRAVVDVDYTYSHHDI